MCVVVMCRSTTVILVQPVSILGIKNEPKQSQKVNKPAATASAYTSLTAYDGC